MPMLTRSQSRMALTIAAVLTLGACSCGSPSAPPADTSSRTPDAAPATSIPSDAFVNRVWQVTESEQVAKGDVRVFLSDGTLVMTSTRSRPVFGSWTFEDGRLTIVEEGQRYETDILVLTPETFQIRMHSPGEPVVIRFAPAPSTLTRVAPAQRP